MAVAKDPRWHFCAPTLQGHRGKKNMDEMRQIISEIDGAERSLLDVRAKEMQMLQASTQNIMVMGSLFGIIMSIAIILLITNNLLKQLGAEPGTIELVVRKIAEGDLTYIKTLKNKKNSWDKIRTFCWKI